MTVIREFGLMTDLGLIPSQQKSPASIAEAIDPPSFSKRAFFRICSEEALFEKEGG